MRIAIIGCGQLARMMALAGLPLGHKFSFLADKGPGSDTQCVEGLGDIVFWQSDLMGEKLFDALKKPDVVTFEKEQVDLPPIESLAPFTPLHPCLKALEVCKNRQNEKTLLDKLNIPSAQHVYADQVADFEAAMKNFPLPAVVKSVSDGYDGKNQWRINDSSDIANVPASAIQGGVIVEEWIEFLREVSLVGVRDSKGQFKVYPITENAHDTGILVRSIAPAADMDPQLREKAQGYIKSIMTELDYVGVLAMECFVTKDNVLVNELAPRVHNSGHWTQNGAVTCQFENHIRAVSELPLGSTQNLGIAGMINILGPNEAPQQFISECSTLHWYNKSIKPGRKLGHVNFITESREQLAEAMDALQKHLV